jgi:site-specific DNA-methyltransferase (adenine-specific)
VLIRQSSKPGELVADPFMGSGSVGVASLRLGRHFRGNDLNPEAVRLAGQRLRALGSGREPAPAEPARQPDLRGLMAARR